ncbi:MAG: NFACT family protein [Firmicutes bacterium]|nr:NFACT family protein [Bacillota bacterium]
MPLDAVCIKALALELNARIAGMKVDKVQQPERDLLLLSLHGTGGNCKLLLSANPGSARVHVTRESFEQPAQPPMFCMLLRKHLQGARVKSVTQPGFDRVLVLTFDSFDELGDASERRLVAELVGRSENLVLVDGEGRILDCLRRADMDRSRPLLPGLIYRLPPSQEKPNFWSMTSAERRRLWENAPPDIAADKWLQSTFSGLSPLLCREIACRAFGDLPSMMDVFSESAAQNEFTPTLVLENGRALDFSFLPLRQYGAAAENQSFPDFSSLLDAYYSRREAVTRLERRGRELTKSVKTLRDRAARKLALREAELLETGNRERLRKYGDLITANLYRMRKGEAALLAQDYCEADSPEISVPLDPLKTPQQNAAKYYKEYTRQKLAERHLHALIVQGQAELDYLDSVLTELSLAEGERDLSAIRSELEAAGFLRKAAGKSDGGKREKPAAQQPLRFLSDAGLEILVGRSNAQNDLLTKSARRSDYWLHVQKFHGAHVILRCADAEPDEQSLRQAAALAAYYSEARGGGKVPVDYVPVKHVKKPPGALPGMVTYTDQRTIVVDSIDSNQ